MKIIIALLLLMLAPSQSEGFSTPTPPGKKQTFSISGGHFRLDGKAIHLLSGEFHYPRTPHQYWRDRLKKAKAMGLNAICTYIFWNRHEPQPGQWNFQGNNDFIAFIKLCQEEWL